MNSLYRIFILLYLLLFGSAATALVITPTDTGSYSQDGSHGNGEYFAGLSLVEIVEGNLIFKEFRNYFVFDLSGVGPVSGATLRAYLTEDTEEGGPGYWGPEPSKTWELYDVTTNLADLMGGPDDISAFADLGSGVVFGQRTVSRNEVGSFVEVSLNVTALAAISSNDGLWAIGGRLLELKGGTAEYIFGYSYLDPRAELVVTTAADVPAPSTVYLLALAFTALCGVLRRDS